MTTYASKGSESFLFLSLPRHDSAYTSTPWQIAHELSKENPVFFVDNPLTFSDFLTGIHKGHVRKRLKSYFGQKSFRKDGIEVIITPFVWPVNFLPKGRLYNFFSKWNHRILARRVNQVLKQKNIHSLVYVNSFNFYFPLLHQYLHARIASNIYHCIDPMIKPFTLRHGPYLQDMAAREAQTIVSTAPALQKHFINKGFSKSYLVPNAANFQLFSKAGTDIEIHPSVKNLPGKTMGYLGNIERRMDFALLLKVMERLPDWTLVLAGPVEKAYIPEEATKHPRIHFTGPVAHTEAPSVIKKFDVAIIPFKCDEVSSGIYPLKLFEYLAAGKPVVSTNFNPEVLDTLRETIHTSINADEFAEFILQASVECAPDLLKKRQQTAAENSWESRARLFKSIISIEFKEQNDYVAQRKNQKQSAN